MIWTTTERGAKARLAPDGNPITEFPPAIRSLLRLHEGHASYAAMYRRQPELRTVVDYIATQVAHVNLKMYERVSDTERFELRDHPMMRLLRQPGGRGTYYRLMHALVSDLCIFDIAYWWKVRQGGAVRALIRIPPTGRVRKGRR